MNTSMNNTMINRKTSEIVQLITTIPSFQRLTDNQRVNDIFSSLKEDLRLSKNIILPGCIIFAKTKTDDYWIIDGLHRFQVYKRILNELHVDFNVFCHEINVKDEEEARMLFIKINDTRDLPDIVEGVNVNIVKGVVEHFVNTYPKIFSNSKSGKCHRPHLHFNGFQEALGRVLLDHNHLEEKEVIKSIEDFNMKSASGNNINEFEKFADLAKNKGGFYLGIITNYEWLDMIFNKTNARHPKRQTIPQIIKNKVWIIENGENYHGKCYICIDKIDITNFHCGHDIAVSKGGETTVDNMKAICSPCNLSMGTRTMAEMKNMFKCNSQKNTNGWV